MLFTCNLPTLTIDSTTQTSNVITGFGDAEALVLYAPAALTGTVTVQVSPATDGAFVDLESSGSDVTLTAGNATVITEIPFSALRLSASIAEGADRNISVQKQFRV